MKQIIQYSFVIVASACIMSCVSSKKYKSSQAEVERLNGEVGRLNGDVAQLNSKTADYDKQVAQLKKENSAYSQEAQDCRMLKESLTKKNEAFKKALAEEGTSMEQIEKKLEAGLEKFAASGADVTYSNGLLHVSLNDQLLFAKRSSKVGPDGIEALATVAEVMKESPKIQLYVVGNTDTDKTKGTDNWSLSTERANSVVRILRDKYNVNPAQMVAAGRGKYNPVADNNTAEGRAKNRRIDLIINANFSKLWELYWLK